MELEDKLYDTEKQSVYSYHQSEIHKTQQQQTIFNFLENKQPKNAANYYLIIAGFFMTIQTIAIKQCSKLPEFHMVFLRAIIMLLISYIYQKNGGKMILNQQTNKKLLIFQSIIIFLFQTFTIFTISLNNYSEAIIMAQNSPIFYGILTYLLVNEKINKQNQIAGIFCIVGFILIVYNNKNINNCIYGLLASIFLTINDIIIKYGGRFIDYMTLTVFSILVQLLFSFILIGMFEFHRIQMPNFLQFFLLIIMGISYFLGQICIQKSQQLSQEFIKKNVVSHVQIILALIFGLLILGEKFDIGQIIGSLIIMLCLTIQA